MSLFRPCIDLHDGVVKQIVGGTLTDEGAKTNFVAAHPPAYYAELYKKDDLTGGHVIKLGPGNDDAAREALAAWRGGLQIGGGITAENAADWLDAGAAKVIVTSYIFKDGELLMPNLAKLLKAVGKEHLVLDLSCRKKEDGNYYIVTDRWQKFTNRKLHAETLDFLADHASEFLIHAVDVEGKQSGIDEELLNILAAHSPLPCTYAGGIHSLSDIETIIAAGNGKIGYTVGSALDIFGGKLPYADIARR
ncbi:MAG: phosphoribosylformimino-5-aminoimidazole carboxamide ribotide isomerase [Lentisphaeria bacterium]|nr:phosphoribosylformimino-5-aminoimidazole carboxamide ribotide isomerase [Lentisphaeria bacterium]